ncbi:MULTISPECIES: glutaredoxin family protein [Nocardia]|uniref:glutaredoxin family protein n=1 Tax=Nocardia TaxID=1817 RepID=UPI000D691794|nr:MULTISPECIES: glutaredoxin family protein [Nocardia]
MPPDVTLYSSPGCQPCKATARKLDQLGIAHARIDVTEDPDALAYIKGLGYTAAPVVVAGEDHWTGFRLTKIEALAASMRPQVDE